VVAATSRLEVAGELEERRGMGHVLGHAIAVLVIDDELVARLANFAVGARSADRGGEGPSSDERRVIPGIVVCADPSLRPRPS
jgi:hypothetical protein